jgi:hypothetical protein
MTDYIAKRMHTTMSSGLNPSISISVESHKLDTLIDDIKPLEIKNELSSKLKIDNEQSSYN